MHRNKEVFGDDIESFRPDRWLKDDSGDMGRISATRLQGVERLLIPGTPQNGSSSLSGRAHGCVLEEVGTL